MKKTITEEIDVCDVCGSDERVYSSGKCLHCGKCFCYECREKHGIVYGHSVYCRGSGDGLYCIKCDAELFEKNQDDLYLAYRAIWNLGKEATAFNNDFSKRKEKAEKLLERKIEINTTIRLLRAANKKTRN